jgi:hypothetical protein
VIHYRFVFRKDAPLIRHRLEKGSSIENDPHETEAKVVSVQLAQKPQGGRPEGGTSAAARAINITRDEARRAEKIARITPEAQQAASVVRRAGLFL